MKNRMRNNRNSGFTLAEMLMVVGIAIILLGVSMVSVARYIDVLKIAELDNAAREIYMAAENRAVLLSSAQRLDGLVQKTDASAVAAAATKTIKNNTDLAGVSNLKDVHPENPAVKENLYYVSVKELGDLLDFGNIDPALLYNGEFYIVYNLDTDSSGSVFTGSGSVTDVFYAEKSKTDTEPLSTILEKFAGVADDFAAFYGKWADTRSARLGLKNEDLVNPDRTLVGWYNGASAEGDSFEQTIEVTPYINVDIENREELTVTVTVRGEYFDQINSGATLEVRLKGSSGYEPLLDVDGTPRHMGEKGAPMDTNGDGADDTIVYSWVLDSLKDGKNQFKEIVARTKEVDGAFVNYYIVVPGDNFTVEATITKGTEVLASADDKDNSLFWYDKTGVTDLDSGDGNGIAYIKYLRHLQNLDASNGHDSGVRSDITGARQVGDILGDNNETYSTAGNPYKFIPIVNDNLTIYTVNEKTEGNGDYYAIRNLTLRADSGTAVVGLFRTTSAVKNVTLEHIRLVNTKVSPGAVAACVGALVGETHADTHTAIKDCWVYWEVDRGMTNLKKLVESPEDDLYRYQLKGRTVGGLVGAVNGSTEIENSLAATLIMGSSAEGTSYAGGLVGHAKSSVTIKRSYADCYLTGSGQVAGLVAGLVGNADSGVTVTLDSCYAAGFILGGSKAAGLCLGGGTTKAHNVYTVMLYPGMSAFDYLTEHHTLDTLVDTYFLSGSGSVYALDDDGEQVKIRNSTLRMMKRTDSDTDDGNTGFAKDVGSSFAWKAVNRTHAYELRTNLDNRYIYPGLKDMPHYGDWGDVLANPTLVYYERSGVSYQVNGLNTVGELSDNLVIEEDGYALTLAGAPGENVTVTYTIRYTDRETGDPAEKTFSKIQGTLVGPVMIVSRDEEGNPVSEEVCLLPLPTEVINNKEFASEDFYQYIRIELDYGQSISKEFIFNPHFARAVASANNGETAWTDSQVIENIKGSAEALAGVSIRTPRHLYFLSVHGEYYNKGYVFDQELDLDYQNYNGYNNFIKGTPLFDGQEPIGSQSAPFLGVYEGNYHTITNVIPNKLSAKRDKEEDDWYWGLFGYSKGALQNIVYQLNPNQMEFATLGEDFDKFNRIAVKYAGVLAGGNGEGGIISNCAAWGINLQASVEHGYGFIGGLVGQNLGTIERCEAEFAWLFVNYLSGLEGYTGGLVGINGRQQTSASPDDEIQTAALNAASSAGTIRSSYAVGLIEIMGDQYSNVNSRICGFAGYNSGRIESSYSATHLKSSGGIVDTRGFSGATYGEQTNTFFLAEGNFTYRQESFGANYTEYKAQGTSYEMLWSGEADAASPNRITNTDNPFGKLPDWERVSENSAKPGKTGDEDEKAYPYPASVTTRDKDNNVIPIHYGSWPGKMAMGGMGVFYWEKLVINGNEADAQYYIYALAVEEGKITRRTTLSQAHADGGAVTEYGYGYYYKNDDSVMEPVFSTEHINFAINRRTVAGVAFTDANTGELNRAIKDNSDSYFAQYPDKVPFYDNTKLVGLTGFQQISEIFCGSVNDVLNEQMPEFTFWAWPCFHEGGRPAEIYSDSNFRDAQATPGLTPDTSASTNNGKGGWRGGYQDIDPGTEPLVANKGVSRGIFTLTQGDLSVRFVVNTHFAASISVDSVKVEGETVDKTKWAGSGITADPGTQANPFQIRCGLQLQNINTFAGGNCASPVGLANANQYMYLTSDTKNTTYHFDGRLYWLQTHDLDMAAEGAYYYTCDDPNCDGYTEALKYSGFVPIRDAHLHTCDLEAHKEPSVFYSIAANHLVGNYDAQLNAKPVEGQLVGYFAGVFDGQNFTMKNFKIVTVWEDRFIYDVNCVGLFGAVKNAHLKNIVMYAEDDNTASSLYIMGQRLGNVDEGTWKRESADSQRGKFGEDDFPACPGWYAGGVLAGVALNTKIEGCAVAGYTIYDYTQVAGTSTDGDVISSNGLGGAVGGLVGLTDSPLDGCTAVVKIVLADSFTYTTKVNGIVRVNTTGNYTHESNGRNSPVRVGGLVGSTTNTVTNCYTGGSIVVSESAKYANIYAGRIIGGSGIEPFVKTGTTPTINVAIKNCYSYMAVTGVADTNTGSGLRTTIYHIGGSDKGDGYAVTMENNYYLTGTDKGNGVSTSPEEAMELTYAQLAGTAPIKGSELKYAELNGETVQYNGKEIYENDIYAALNVYDPETGAYTNVFDRDKDDEDKDDEDKDKVPYFTRVTDEVGGLAAAGRFSYVPKTRELEYLQGYDYPFATVLIQRRNDVENGIAYVHYGEWPGGIIRAKGNQPLYLNAFTGDWEDLETLMLADGIAPGGKWSVTWEYGSLQDSQAGGDPIAVSFVSFGEGVDPYLENISGKDRAAYLGSGPRKELEDKTGEAYLYIAALRECTEPVTVTVHYTLAESGSVKTNEYTLDIIVYLAADRTKAIQSDSENLTLYVWEEAEALNSGKAELTLGGALGYMDGTWSVSWQADGVAGVNPDIINVSFGDGDSKDNDPADDESRGVTPLYVTVREGIDPKSLNINATVTVRYTVYKLDENSEKVLDDDGNPIILYEYTKDVPVCITDNVIKITNSGCVGGNFTNGRITGDVFRNGYSGISGWANLALNDLFTDISGTWTVSWVAGGVEKSQVIEDAYFTDGNGGKLESPTGRSSPSMGIRVRTDITGITDGTSHNLEDLKDAAVTVKYTTADGVECKLVVPVELVGYVRLAVASSGGITIDKNNEIITVLGSVQSMTLWTKNAAPGVGYNDLYDNNKVPGPAGAIQTGSVSAAIADGPLVLDEPAVTDSAVNYCKIALKTTAAATAKQTLTVTYTFVNQGYSKECTDEFILEAGPSNVGASLNGADTLDGGPVAALPSGTDDPEIPEPQEVSDPDPVESEPKDPDQPEMEIPEPPEEPEDRTDTYGPEPEQAADVPSKPKESEDDPDADGPEPDPEPGSGPDPDPDPDPEDGPGF